VATRWTVRTAAGAVAVAATALAGCSSGGTAPVASGAASIAPADLTKARAALAQSKAELHAVVDALVGSAAAGSKAPFTDCRAVDVSPPAGVFPPAVEPGACAGFDSDAPCVVGEKWPSRWGYNVNVHVVGTEATNSGKAVISALKAAKWTVVQNAANKLLTDVTATKNGAELRVVVDDVPGVVNLEGYGPCVSALGGRVAG